MPVSRQRVRDFYQARMSRDPAIIAQFLHDDVEWTIAGPVELLRGENAFRHRGCRVGVVPLTRCVERVVEDFLARVDVRC